MAKFWWGQVGTSKKQHWISWSHLSLPKNLGGLDFKDFILFNQALLAKQCWRILQQPELLLSRVLRAKYFEGQTILQAREGSRASPGFQGLLHGLHLLKQGLRWQIGSGYLLHPLHDNWIPGTSPQPAIQRSEGPYIGPPSVAGYISLGRWDLPLLQAHFSDSSISDILQLPLTLTPYPDSLVWHYSGTGVYSTSSGYDLAYRLKKPKKPRKHCVDIQDSVLWLSSWEIPVQPKLQFFIWSLLHRILPTMECLASRGMELALTCPVCHLAEETIEHMLFDCPVSLAFYRMARLTPPLYLNTHFAIYWKFILQHHLNLAPVWVLAWWRVWKCRNHVVFNHSQFRIEAMFDQFSSHLSELPLFQDPSPSQPPLSFGPLSPRHPIWTPPRQNRLKINMDGAVCSPQGGATGWVLRSPDGTVLYAFGTPYPGILDPFILELLACRDAVAWYVFYGLFQVDFEGDAELVAKAVRDHEGLRSTGGLLSRKFFVS
ncbi:Putative ribonuclease H protein At1g65750 [Linum perenne]